MTVETLHGYHTFFVSLVLLSRRFPWTPMPLYRPPTTSAMGP